MRSRATIAFLFALSTAATADTPPTSTSAIVPTLKTPPTTLVDPDATPAARRLLQRLVDDYGSTTRSGVVTQEDARFVYDCTGVWPAIMGGDLMDFSPSRLPFGTGASCSPKQLIDDAKAGFIITLMWHWNAPTQLLNTHYKKDGVDVDASWYRGFYTNATTFDVADALAHPDGEHYRLLLRDIDAIAAQLKKFDAAGVPILWRPLHEGDGGWFWWGAKGPDAFKGLWSLLHDRLTRVHHLHNLIWVYAGTTQWDWYPPADQFDVIGVDHYTTDRNDLGFATWIALQSRWGDRKLLALTEFGGVPDIAAMRRLGIRWSYFASWTGEYGPATLPRGRLKALYLAPGMSHRDAAN